MWCGGVTSWLTAVIDRFSERSSHWSTNGHFFSGSSEDWGDCIYFILTSLLSYCNQFFKKCAESTLPECILREWGRSVGFAALLPAHYCAGLVPRSLLRRLKFQDVSAISGRWRLQFSPMEESEGASSIFFYSLWCKQLRKKTHV